MGCPRTDCRAARPVQRQLFEGELALLDKPSWSTGAQLCTYCGCVYSREADGREVERGWLNAPMMPQGWRPSRA